MTRVSASICFAAILAFSAGTSAASATGWPDCGPEETVRYTLDASNATGWRHDLSRPLPDEVAWFEDNGDLVIMRDGATIRYVTGAGGTGLRQRVGRAGQLAEDDPVAAVSYIFYDLSSIAAKGRPDLMLMIDGDIFWPSCRER